MPVELCHASVQKLTHESCEIRLRTLEQIEAKVMRALAHNEEIHFKPGELFKQLIRWFGCQPLEKTQKVLRLMLELLRSCYGEQVIEQIGLERCQRELGKVQQILKGGKSSDLLMVEKLLQFCNEYKLRQELTIEELSELTSIISISDSIEAEIETQSHTSSSQIDFPEMDFEIPWSKATIADYNSMKFLVDLLVNPLSSCDELLSALQHLYLTMADYPAEYFLQEPHIFLNMAKMYERHEELQCPLEDILNVFLVFVDSLRQRLYIRTKSLSYAPILGSVVMHKTQLKLTKVLQLVMELCMAFLEKDNKALHHETLQIIALIRVCLDIFASQKLTVNIQTTARLTKICQTLKDSYSRNEHSTLQRINYLLLVFLLQRMIEINWSKGEVINSPHLFTMLNDYAIKACYPQSYQRLQQLILSQDASDLKIQFELLDKYEQQFFHMVTLLKTPKTFNAVYIIEKSSDLMPAALNMFASPQIISTLFDAISSCLPQYLGNCALRKKANKLLIKLLSQTNEKFAVCAFNHLAERFKQHFCALMNGTGYYAAVGCCNSKLLAAQIIGVPLSTSLLLKLTHASFESSDTQIRQCCEDILSMLLRSQHLLDSHWCRLLELVLPIMPMLQCCTKSAKINKALLKLFDPDARQIPFTDLLKCNTRWLFHPDSEVRSECLTRLIYMLQTLEKAPKYVPNLSEVSDLIPNDICLVSVPRSNSTIFNISTTSSSEDLYAEVHNLLAILESPDIEPIIRKTTLLQLNLMCSHWDYAVSVCRDGGYYFALQALENSLCMASYEDYQDTAIPAIGILVKLLFCDAEFRDELQGTDNIYVLLLRAIFLYVNDLQVKQDAAVCLFLLLYSTFVITSPPGSSDKGIKVPLIMSNLEMPLKCELSAEKDEVSDYYAPLNIFKTSADEKIFLRQLIACTFADGMCKLNSSWLEKQKQYDFNVELLLTPREWRLLKATQPLQNLRRFLKAAANATNHTTIINAAIALRHQLVLSDLEDAVSAQQIPNEMAQDLLRLLSRYLQVLPGNDMDFVLFEQLLEVCYLCTQLQCNVIINGLFKALQTDFQHAFIVMLQNSEIPMRLYRKLTLTILRLVQHHAAVDAACSSTNSTTNAATIFYINLFELLFDVGNLFFDQRDLLRVRCVLSLLEMLSTKPLEMTDKQLFFYCKRFLNLSISLKSFTQTGAQWQRDCLQLVCRLSSQMEQPNKTFKLNASFIKYLSGMCGHNDNQVRALAWCLLAAVARFKEAELSGVSQLTEELAFLPGGFMACSLSTLLDYAEVGIVRQLAGNLFAEVLPKSLNYVEASALLEQHDFYRVFHDALSLCELNPILPADFDYTAGVQLNTCEIVSCFCRICISMIHLHPSYAAELCEHTFMYKLYELLKVPVSNCSIYSPEYLLMCADICQLYAMCFGENFPFLQRTICRDQVWIRCFCLLLDKPYADEMDQINIFQLLLAICKDPAGFQHVCEHIAKAPEFIVRVFMQTFCVARINTALQQCALTVLSYLLINSHPPDMEYDFVTFADILEKPVELTEVLNVVNEQENLAKAAKKYIKVADFIPTSSNSQLLAAIKCYHQIPGINCNGFVDKNADTDSSTTSSTSQQAAASNCQVSCSKSAAEFIFIELHRLFLHLYPLKACKFETAPNVIKQQICETIAVLLKTSPLAQTAACNLKFFDTLLQIFNTFLEEFKTSCSTFVRRNGDSKKMAIIKNFQLLFNIVLNWFSSGVTVLVIDLQVLQFSKILLQIWPWLTHSAELKLLTLQMCSVLNEHSLIVCKQFSTLISSYANSILQLVLKIVVADTQKVKAASSDEFPVIAAGLRVLINCCKCTEGRSALTKARILDIFDSIYPLNPKANKLKIDIVISWLQFWEQFSRYSDCAQVRNLNSLCTLINKSKENSKTRILALCILRNMCFENANRSTLIASTDFMYIVNDVICKRLDETSTECTSYEEQLIVCVSIRKLISGGVKYVAMIRGSKLGKKFKLLHEQLKSMDAEKLNKLPFAKDLNDVLDAIFCIFSN